MKEKLKKHNKLFRILFICCISALLGIVTAFALIPNKVSANASTPTETSTSYNISTLSSDMTVTYDNLYSDLYVHVSGGFLYMKINNAVSIRLYYADSNLDTIDIYFGSSLDYSTYYSSSNFFLCNLSQILAENGYSTPPSFLVLAIGGPYYTSAYISNAPSVIYNPTVESKTGYYGYYYYDASYTMPYEKNTLLSATVQLYTKYEPIYYTSGLVVNNEFYNFVGYTIESDDIILPNLEQEGYVFDGWYLDADCTTNPISVIETGTTGNMTFYAKLIIYRTVTFFVDDEIYKTITVLDGEKMGD